MSRQGDFYLDEANSPYNSYNLPIFEDQVIVHTHSINLIYSFIFKTRSLPIPAARFTDLDKFNLVKFVCSGMV